MSLSLPGAATEAEGERLDLGGTVVAENGSPLKGATVFIYTARPRVGTGIVCPSCYTDCSKRATSDGDGRFRIESLDPKLLFRLLVVAPGYKSQHVEAIDPATNEEVEIAMDELSPAALASDRLITGRVVDADGQPLVGASISPEGVSYPGGTRWGRVNNYVERVAVTDSGGRFLLPLVDGADKEVSAVHALVEARGFAKQWVELAPGEDHPIVVLRGVTINGRVVQGDQALQGVDVGVATTSRRAGDFIRLNNYATDSDGYFVLPNVPPDSEVIVFAAMDSFADRDGAIHSRILTTGTSDTVIDLESVAVQPAHRIAGRVVLSDGGEIPANTRMILSRDKAWDYSQVVLDAEGRFEFLNVPAESISLGMRIRGYRFAENNPSLDWLNGGGLIGRVASDVDDLIMVLEPGEWDFDYSKSERALDELRPVDQPLRGAKLAP